MARRTCKICGADVGSAEFDTCGRHACQRAALGPGADDVSVAEELAARDELAAVAAREFAASRQEVLSTPEPEPPVSTSTLRARLAAAGRRREYVWLAGRADLLQRCTTFGPMARAQPR